MVSSFLAIGSETTQDIFLCLFLVSTYRFSGQSFPGVRADAHAVPKEPLAASASGVELGLAGGADVLVLQSAFQGGAAVGTIAALGGCSRRCLCCLIGGGHDVYTSFQSYFAFTSSRNEIATTAGRIGAAGGAACCGGSRQVRVPPQL